MKKQFYYDLHIHSALSPCADDMMTPNNIAGFASLNGLNIVALTDHNSAKNCPPFFDACHRYGVIPVAGMELTCSEEIHLVCLFPSIDKALSFDEAVSEKRMKIKNKTEVFGNQFLFDDNDNVVATDEYFLPVATGISLAEAVTLVKSHFGISYPAHIDRQANGIIAILGTFPDNPAFTAYELHNQDKKSEYCKAYSVLNGMTAVSSSDAHRLEEINGKVNSFSLDGTSQDEVVKNLFSLISGKTI